MATPAQALATAPIPPQNLDAEESVLGAMMLSPLAIGAVTESTNLSASDFYRESHGHIYRAILALYAKGLTTRDIQDIVQELYGVEVSPTLISEITADLDGEVSLWRSRRLAAGPCRRSSAAASMVPPQVRKSFAVTSRPEASRR